MRRSVGICAIRQNAQLKEQALRICLGKAGFEAAYQRRLGSKNWADTWYEQYARFATTGRRDFPKYDKHG